MRLQQHFRVDASAPTPALVYAVADLQDPFPAAGAVLPMEGALLYPTALSYALIPHEHKAQL